MAALNEFHEALVDFRDDPDLWAAIITGAGEKGFLRWNRYPQCLTFR